MLSINILDGNTRCEGWVFMEENYKNFAKKKFF